MTQPLKALLSLITQNNDYQRANAAAAEAAATRLGFALQVLYADNDAVNQVQQILSVIQQRNHGISVVITQPVGTGMRNVAESAAKMGIGWCVLNREVDYIAALRATTSAPIFTVGLDQLEVGRIHAEQVSHLLPKGGNILYLAGPGSGGTAVLRLEGFVSQKPANVELKIIRGNWTQDSGQQIVSAWLKLKTSRSADFVAVLSQNDAMAAGARRAFTEIGDAGERDRWLTLPFFGCDGLPDTGQLYVQRKLLTATIITPPLAGTALELFASAGTGKSVPESTTISCTSFPALNLLRPSSGGVPTPHQ